MIKIPFVVYLIGVLCMGFLVGNRLVIKFREYTQTRKEKKGG